ncbi:MAG: VWA domain-containing protein [Chloroflexi bacterium]|nr:VWA domain-containing protein [Chloroflexota bacterium]
MTDQGPQRSQRPQHATQQATPQAAARQGFGAGAPRRATVDDVDGRQLLATAVAFGRELRAAGLQIDLGAAIDFARALTLVHIGDRDEVKAAGATVFIRRRDDLEVYGPVFDRFWSSRRSPLIASELTSLIPATPDMQLGMDGSQAEDDERRASKPRPSPLAPTPADGEAEEKPIDGVVVAPDAYSRGEVIRHKDFERMTSAELREAERLVDLLRPNLELRRTRRSELHHHGRTLAPRAMFRANLAAGGDLVEWIWKRRVKRPRPLVVVCDISGSMERQSRLLLRFVQALSGSAVHAEAFVFGTHLTRVTRLLRDRDRDRALAKVSATVNDWAGGTRIGESLRQFNQRWARRVLRSGAVVVVVSDGWDRGDPRLVAQEMERLQRSCHRLIWLNPLAGAPGYQPLAGGMQAAYPFIDDFLPAGTVANLERLGEILAGNSPGRVGGRPHRRAGGRRVPSTEEVARNAAAIRIRRGSDAAPARLANRQGAWAGPDARRTTGFTEPTRAQPLAADRTPSAPRRLA